MTIERIGEVLDRVGSGPRPVGPCAVCGKTTAERFFGHWCCLPYDERGQVVSRCKEALSDRTPERYWDGCA